MSYIEIIESSCESLYDGVGGCFSDFLKHESNQKEADQQKKNKPNLKKEKSSDKLSFKFKYELENLPIETEIKSFSRFLVDFPPILDKEKASNLSERRLMRI